MNASHSSRRTATEKNVCPLCGEPPRLVAGLAEVSIPLRADGSPVFDDAKVLRLKYIKSANLRFYCGGGHVWQP